jgi:hypothetical protein
LFCFFLCCSNHGTIILQLRSALLHVLLINWQEIRFEVRFGSGILKPKCNSVVVVVVVPVRSPILFYREFSLS